jgi:hypothetical protein
MSEEGGIERSVNKKGEGSSQAENRQDGSEEHLGTELEKNVDNPHVQAAKKKRYEIGKKYQEHWPTMFPWSQNVNTASSVIGQVLCIICSKIEGVLFYMQAKKNTLEKYEGRRKVVQDIEKLNVKAGQYYVDPNCKHQVNLRECASRKPDTVHRQLSGFTSLMRKTKVVNFTALFYLLKIGCPMADYPQLKGFVNQFGVPHFNSSHWSETSGWEIASALCHVIFSKMKTIL